MKIARARSADRLKLQLGGLDSKRPCARGVWLK